MVASTEALSVLTSMIDCSETMNSNFVFNSDSILSSAGCGGITRYNSVDGGNIGGDDLEGGRRR